MNLPIFSEDTHRNGPDGVVSNLGLLDEADLSSCEFLECQHRVALGVGPEGEHLGKGGVTGHLLQHTPEIRGLCVGELELREIDLDGFLELLLADVALDHTNETTAFGI